jgi:anaerobic magnesium-protoporphyrin IX monomethyl ester cyclase
MSKVLFGQSYYLRFDPKLYAQMQPYPPLGSLYAASYVRRLGYDVAFFDAMLAQSEMEWGEALDRHRPRYAVLFEDNFNYLSKMCLLRMRQAAFRMIEMAKGRGCTVIVNGSDATDHLEAYFEQGTDYVLIGEGEVTLGELLDALEGRGLSDLDGIRGLAWRDEGGVSRRTQARAFIRDLDSIPFPAWDLVDIPRYRHLWRARHGYYSMNLVTTRGCPYHCNWCAKPIYGQRYNVRSPENVVDEMEWLEKNFEPDHIWFADDIFGLKPHWIERFTELVTERGCGIPFKCLLRADLVKDSTVDALASAKCRVVWMGAESGSQKILNAMDKGTTVEQIYAAAERLHRVGIRVGFFLQFGYSGEDRSDIEKTLKMVRECHPDEIGVSVSYPLPGTKFYERVKTQLGDKQNWVDSDDLAMMYRGTYASDFYRVLYRVVHHEFRMRQGIAQVRRDFRHPSRWRLSHLRLLGSIPWQWLKLQLVRARLNQLERAPQPPAMEQRLNRITQS